MHRWIGPAVIIGLESNNLWLSHRGAVVKAASRHVRPAEPEELVPWDQIYETAEKETATVPAVPNEFLDLNEANRPAPAPAHDTPQQEEEAPGREQQGDPSQREEEPQLGAP